MSAHRKRRIASDEAHAWARHLRLGNAYAKSVLMALALYVNGDGVCFVSIEQLAADTELSADTVRRRLAWLDQVGAIVRLPQWIDENGKRNSDGRGKRTTDEIRLLIDADGEGIEARAKGDRDDSGGEVSAGPQQGLNERPDTAVSPSCQPGPSPRLALGQPSQCSEGLISEPEPEDSPPTPPPGGGVGEDAGWKEFERDWQEPVLRQSLAQQVWSALTAQEKATARKAARGYVVWRKNQKKPPNVLGAHLFLKERDAWPKFATMAPDEPTAVPPLNFVAEGSLAWRALAVMAMIAGNPSPRSQAVEHGQGRMVRSLSAAELALARFAEDDPDQWMLAKAGTKQCGAWREFLKIEPRAIVVGYTTKEILGRTMTDWPVKESGLRVPCEFPPRKDGSISSTGPPETLMTEDDIRELANFR